MCFCPEKLRAVSFLFFNVEIKLTEMKPENGISQAMYPNSKGLFGFAFTLSQPANRVAVGSLSNPSSPKRDFSVLLSLYIYMYMYVDACVYLSMLCNREIWIL